MSRSFVRSLLLLIAVAISSLVFAQADKERTLQAGPRKAVPPRDNKTVIGAAYGLLPAFLQGGEQRSPTLQFTAQRFITDRMALGLAFATSESESEAYTDDLGVESYLTAKVTNVSGRLSGSIVRNGPIELYGGLQLGINLTKASERHVFPQGIIENEDEYIANRPSPFGDSRPQLSAVGFLGVSVEVLPHVHAAVEIGNNLSLLAAGVEIRL